MVTIPDAPESNAGDDFHILWAARKALSLLNLGGTLRAIRPEGPHSLDAIKLDSSGKSLLGIDVVEYHGANDKAIRFETADQVVFSQLKYSTRRSSDQWTVARLIRGKKSTPNGSVVHRLSSPFKAAVETFGREATLKKLSVLLVSNQPCDSVLLEAVSAAKQVLSQHDSLPMAFASLKRRVSKAQYQLLADLKKGAVGLRSTEYCDFLRLLDLKGCGADSRLLHELALYQELGDVGFQDTQSQFDRLKGLIIRWTMPENRNATVITPTQVAATLGKPTLESLFPAPARFDPIGRLVDRHAVTDAVASIRTNSLLCVHGPAGIGKTTVIRSLSAYLPQGSVVVLFDCYGGGSYLDTAEVRHEHSRAVPQIANDLAREVGSPLLLATDLKVSDLLRELRRRLLFSINVIRRANADALLLIIVDAADNSVAAATAHGSRSFVHDLAELSLPDGCRIVVTARSHRVGELRLPIGTQSYQIPAFSDSESASFFRGTFSSASDAQCNEFHQLTRGIPRVARYATSDAKTNLSEVLSLLRPSGQTVASLVDAQLREADRRAGGSGFIGRVCAALLALPRPIPVQYVALLANCNQEAITDLEIDLWRGLRIDQEQISFRDEDFENHLRDRYAPDLTLRGRVAEILRSRSDTESYAASHIADALYQAGDKDALIELLYRDREPLVVIDPVERKEVFARRARFALMAAIERNNSAHLIRLLVVVSDAMKSDRAVEDLLLENADLACRYGNPTTVQRLYLSKDNDRIGWYGPTHLKCAAAFSRLAKSALQARSHLNAGVEWLRWWMTLPKESRDEFNLDADDLANGAEATLRLDGIDEGIKWLSRWRPASVVFRAAQHLVRSLVDADGTGSLAAVSGKRVRSDILLLIVDAAMSACLPIDSALVSRAVKTWSRVARKTPTCDASIRPLGISLCEAALLHKCDAVPIVPLLRFFSPATPDRVAYLDAEGHAYVTEFLRVQALLSAINGGDLKATDNELLPERLREAPAVDKRAEHTKWKEEVDTFHELYHILLPSIRTRADQMSHRGPALQSGDCATLYRANTSSGYSRRQSFDLGRMRKSKARLLTEVVCRSPNPVSSYAAFCGRLEEHGISTLLDTADTASQSTALHDAVVGTIDRCSGLIEATPMPATEKVSLLVRCSRVCSRIDGNLGLRYFESAVKAAADIDIEMFSLLTLLSAAAKRVVKDSPHCDEPALSAALSRIIEDCHWRLGDDDNFPWLDSIDAIACLSPRIAESAICRWDQRGVIGVHKSLVPLVQSLASRKTLSSRSTIAWSLFSPPHDAEFLDATLSAVKRLQAESDAPPGSLDQALKILADIPLRLARLDLRKWMAGEVMKWSIDCGLAEHESLAELRALHVLTEPRPHDPHAFSSRASTVENSDLKSSDAASLPAASHDNDASSTERLEELLSKLPSSPRYSESSYPDGDQAVLLLSSLAEGLPPNKYVAYLDAVVRISSSLLHWWDLEKVLRTICGKWNHHPDVRSWRGQLPEILAECRFDIFISDSNLSDYTIRSLCDAFGVDPNAILTSLIKRLPLNVRSVPPAAMHDVAKRLIERCAPGDAIWFLNQCIPDLEGKLSATALSTTHIETSNYPDGLAPQHLSGLLWYLLGHPDTRLRWHAVHISRSLVALGHREILIDLSQWLEVTAEHPLGLPEVTFYRYAAKQWLLVLLDRVSRESPEIVMPLAARILKETIAPDAPHALCMHIAKRIVVRLQQRNPSLFSSEEMDAIRQTSEPRQPPLDENDEAGEWLDARYQSEDQDENYEFDVDSSDTLPRWYASLGRRFGVSASFIEKKAAKWVRRAWHFSGTPREADPLHKWREHRVDWELMSNRQGIHPTIENLQTYFEIHAMHCVAGELLAARPVSSTGWCSSRDNWHGWLDDWDITKGKSWLCERRGRAPFEQRFWFRPEPNDWESNPTSEDFDLLVGLREPIHPKMFVVWAEDSIHAYQDYRSTSVRTALVPRSLSDSLIHAFHASDPGDYWIPDEKDDGEIDIPWRPDRFSLKGWIRYVEHDAERMEEHDPFRYRFAPSVLRPGRQATQQLGLKESRRHPRTYLREGCNMPSVTIEEWECAFCRPQCRG